MATDILICPPPVESAIVPAPRRPRSRAGDFILCLSIANLLFIRVWLELLTYTRRDTFFMRQPPARAAYLGVVLSVIICGAALWLAYQALVRIGDRRFGRSLRTFGSVVLLLVFFNQFRLVLSTLVPELYPYLRQPLIQKLGAKGAASLVAFALAASAWPCIRFNGSIRRAIRHMALILAPLPLILFAQAAWYAYSPPAFAANYPPAPVLATNHAARVVWIVFDEWDYRLTFPDRPANLLLPEVDRFAASAMTATDALAPARDTIPSVPSLIVGQTLAEVRPVALDSALVRAAGQTGFHHLQGLPSVFSSVRSLGMNSSVVGWYLPYCRLWNDSLSQCQWWSTDAERIAKDRELAPSLVSLLRSMVETGVVSPFGIATAAARASLTREAVVTAAARAVRDRQMQLVFIHVPLPHPPFYYDRSSGRFDRGNNYTRGYLDHLALLDQTVGLLRRQMEGAGVWRNTAVLLTADHPYRAAESLDGKISTRVPFLLKLPGQSAGWVWNRRLATVRSSDLICRILTGSVSSTDDLAQWLQN